MGISGTVKSALEPFVGPIVADTCVRATALSLGKMSDELDAGDLDALESRVRQLLGPVAPRAAIDDALASMRQTISTGV